MNQLFTPTTSQAECARILVDGNQDHRKQLPANAKGFNERLLELNASSLSDHVMVENSDLRAYGDSLIANLCSGTEERTTASSARFSALTFSTRRFS
jgi:hypothetical protein